METIGFLAVNKPSGPTSHDLVDMVRKITGVKTVGHAGTLDPFATGVLIIGIGRPATKRLTEWHQFPKTYIATMTLGQTSNTYDRTGVIRDGKTTKPSLETLQTTLQSFIGCLAQLPPMHSARKVGGIKLYELARQGKMVLRKPKSITIHNIQLVKYDYPTVVITVECSTGTYIRSLANDLGEKLGTGALLQELERTNIGPIGLDRAVSVKDLATKWRQHLLPVSILDANSNITN
ncbi:MAG: tRNA pseudouridine(55) synthase TruB [bacterium]